MVIAALGRGRGPDLCLLEDDQIGVVYGEQTGPRTEGQCVFEVRDASLRRIRGPIVLPVSQTVNCQPRIRVIAGVVHVAYMRSNPDTGWVWAEDTGDTLALGPVGGMRPVAWGRTAVYRVDQQQPARTVWQHPVPTFGNPTVAATRQTSQGLARIEDDGAIVFAEDQSLHGLWSSAVCQVHDLTVLENSDDGLVVSIAPQIGSLQVFPGQAGHDPRAVRLSDGSYVLATSGVPDGIRLIRVSAEDIAGQPTPTVVPYGSPLFAGSAGVYWTGRTERAPGTCTLVDAAYPELHQALRHYASIIVDGYEASIAGAAPCWDRVRAVSVFCETSQAQLQQKCDEAVAAMQTWQLPRRPVLAYRGRHDDWSVPADHPEAIWYALEVYPDPKDGRDSLERRIARARTQLPPGAPLVLFCGTYDRRGLYTNLGRLVTLHRVYAEQLAACGAQGRGVVFWHFADEGASCGASSLSAQEPGLLWWQQAIVKAAGVAPPILTIPDGEPSMPTFENMYDELIAISQTSANWHQALHAATEAERLDGCEQFMNEVAWCFNDDKHLTPGAPGSYGKLWRGAKKYSDDCVALIASDGVLYENDLITNGGGTDAVLKWGNPVVSKWVYHAPTDPYAGEIPGPEPPQPPTGDDDVHYAINGDEIGHAMGVIEKLSQDYFGHGLIPPGVGRYGFEVWEPLVQTELNKIGHLPGDWSAIRKTGEDAIHYQMILDHPNGTPAAPSVKPWPQEDVDAANAWQAAQNPQ